MHEGFVKIGGKPMHFGRAVDGEGEVLDVVVQKQRNKLAALKLLRKLLYYQAISPTKIVSDLPSNWDEQR